MRRIARHSVLFLALLVIVAATWSRKAKGQQPTNVSSQNALFPGDLPSLEWVQFKASGFSQPVSGLIFRSDKPACCGVALGGLGTGSLDIETSGVLGFSTIFPHRTHGGDPWHRSGPRPRQPQLQSPFLGLAVEDRVWVLAADKYIKGGTIQGCLDPLDPFLKGVPEKETAAWQTRLPTIEGVGSAKEVSYWGHFPVADLEYETDAPVSVGLRAWAPFIPGDAAASNIPGAVFELHLRNTADRVQRGTIAFSFPGPAGIRPDYGAFNHTEVQEENLHGVVVQSAKGVREYVVAAIGTDQVRWGGGLGGGGAAWSKIRDSLPDAKPNDPSASVAVDFKLGPQEAKVVRIVLAWYAPHWVSATYSDAASFYDLEVKRWWATPGEELKKGVAYTAMYATRFKDARDVARRLAQDHASLLQRILAWQQAIYTAEELPVWLRDCLVNNLNLIPEDSYWAAPQPPFGDWAKPLGVFAMDESPRGCPLMGCIASNWLGDMPVTYFFPELDRMLLLDYKEYTRSDGAVPFLYPSGDFTKAAFEYQITLNGPCFADLVDRLWLRTGDDNILREFYPAVKKNTIFTMNLKRPPEGIISAHRVGPYQEWWEHTPVQGMVPHIGGMHLAQLRIAKRMAEAMGDAEFAKQCQEWFDAGSRLLEDNLWVDNSYLFYKDPEGGKVSDLILSNQLDGDWVTSFHGLPAVFRPDRAKKVLETVEKTCLVDVGAAGFADRKEGTLFKAYGTFPPETTILGATYMYHGQRDLGLEIVRRNMDNLVRKQRYAWDLSNLIRADTGARTFGTDYFQNMILWTVPAAMEGEDLAAPCRPGGLVDRVLKAAKKP